MKIICSYCRKDLGVKDPLENKDTTDGICDKCFEIEMKKIRKDHEGKKNK